MGNRASLVSLNGLSNREKVREVWRTAYIRRNQLYTYRDRTPSVVGTGGVCQTLVGIFFLVPAIGTDNVFTGIMGLTMFLLGGNVMLERPLNHINAKTVMNAYQNVETQSSRVFVQEDDITDEQFKAVFLQFRQAESFDDQAKLNYPVTKQTALEDRFKDHKAWLVNKSEE